MLIQFTDHIDKNLAFLRNSKLLLAISGGMDSVVLTTLCIKAGLKIGLAHCNFNLRGEESDQDEDFVIQLAEDNDIEVFIQHFDTNNYAVENKLSTQVAARNLRYTWFKELATQLNYDYILTAHHADDNLETFLINFSRGTGLDGLTGIPELNNNIVRPLLSFSREDIEVCAITNNIKWREDSSNATTNYLRNKLRHNVIPILKNITPNLLNNFQSTLSHLQDSQLIINDKVDEIKAKVLVYGEDNLIKINIKELIQLKNYKVYIYQILKGYKFTQWNDIYGLLNAQSGKQVYSESHRLLKDRDFLILTPLSNILNNELYKISPNLETVIYPGGKLSFQISPDQPDFTDKTVYLDKARLEFPLTLRKWEEGDYFYPLGMSGKKKLSKFFKDEKYSLFEKEEVWLLCSSEKIVWIVNKRMDERFKVTKDTKEILKIEHSGLK